MADAATSLAPPRSRSERFVGDIVDEDPDSGDLDLDDVARSEEPGRIESRSGAGRCAGGDYVPGFQGRESRDVSDEIGDREEHVGGVSSCRVSPLTRVVTRMPSNPSNSSAVTIQGPIEPDLSKFLPGVTLNFAWRNQSRTVPSFMQVSPATCASVSEGGMRRPRFPMTTAISPS